ncbi:MAG: alkaline phosphatase family protein [Alistipes sp.]|nr:alkaline phosphatase family protein [Alistipes sp.]
MKKAILYTAITIALSIAYSICGYAQTSKPRLMVNIVVSSMHANDLTRYSNNFSNGGFNKLRNEGVWFTNAAYDYMQTTTPVSLATISTGAMPSIHGVVADSWFDYVSNRKVSVIHDDKEYSVNFSAGSGKYSPRQLSAQTLSDAVVEHNNKSIIRTIAIEPLSAIIMTGHAGKAYWMETLKSAWTTTSYYGQDLDKWIAEYNRNDINGEFITKKWTPLLKGDNYINSQIVCMEELKSNNKELHYIQNETLVLKSNVVDVYEQMCYSPAGNTAVLSFAKQMIAKNSMGGDEDVDILNIVLDTPRFISSRYGTESLEYEDMLYRLDRDLDDFLTFVLAQVTDARDVVITLTSDHGTSPSYNTPGKEQGRFNVRQAEVITNAFIGSLHGNGEWVLGIVDNAIYLNHNLIYEKGLSIADVQYDVATFVMQMRGVAHALSAEALRSSYFGSGYGRKVQNGFYPRRSGDVIINLMPGWIPEIENVRSWSGTMYNYDTQVPLLIYGAGLNANKHTEKVNMTSLAATQALILGINPPSAAEGDALTIFN